MHSPNGPVFIAQWRIPIGESGILDSFLAILATEGVDQSLMIHALRLVGNSCADTGKSFFGQFLVLY
jgi:hypothetical protein